MASETACVSRRCVETDRPKSPEFHGAIHVDGTVRWCEVDEEFRQRAGAGLGRPAACGVETEMSQQGSRGQLHGTEAAPVI